MSMETLSNQEDLVTSELKEMFWWELNDLHQQIENQDHIEKQRQLVHYSKLSPEELRDVKESRKMKVDDLSDQLTSIASKRLSNATKEITIKKTLELFTPEATVDYNWKWRTLRNIKVEDFLLAVANWQIDISDIDGSNLTGKSKRMRSSLLKPTVVHLPDNDITTYTPLMSSIEIYDLSPERLINLPNLNSDRWASDNNEMLTK